MEVNNQVFEEENYFGNGDILNALYEEITAQEVSELGIEIENERFQITSEEQANFFLRQLNEVRQQMEKITATCDMEVERYTKRVTEFKEKETRTLRNTENYFVTLLENYARIQLVDSKKKSLKTPFGTLAFKKSPDKVVYDDEAVLKFIKDHELVDFIKIKEDINKKDLRACLITDEDGSVKIATTNASDKEQPIYLDIDGIRIEPGEEKFTVK